MLLHIEFNPVIIPKYNGHGRVLQTNLYSLDVGWSPIAKPAAVARYLSTLFPDLVHITTSREQEDNDDPDEIEHNAQAISWHRMWKQVEEHVPEFAATRREEESSGESAESGNVGLSPSAFTY
ncbi:hypothetical protein DFH06DRAFT_1147047 [Mycena polygramma]|nr:hypothetical protein DFH06DRAFT_1147047 [Mycena polygramma]